VLTGLYGQPRSLGAGVCLLLIIQLVWYLSRFIHCRKEIDSSTQDTRLSVAANRVEDANCPTETINAAQPAGLSGSHRRDCPLPCAFRHCAQSCLSSRFSDRRLNHHRRLPNPRPPGLHYQCLPFHSPAVRRLPHSCLRVPCPHHHHLSNRCRRQPHLRPYHHRLPYPLAPRPRPYSSHPGYSMFRPRSRPTTFQRPRPSSRRHPSRPCPQPWT
jgi:hypothetical protein